MLTAPVLALAFTPGVVAWETSARHDLVPSVGVLASWERPPVGVTAEAVYAGRRDENAGYVYRTHTLRVDALADVALGTHATTFYLGVGPAATLRQTSADLDGDVVSGVRPSVGGRLRVGLDGPFSPKHPTVGWSWTVGATSRGLDALDYDLSLGIGARLGRST